MSVSYLSAFQPDFELGSGVRIYYNKNQKIGRIDVASELALGAIPRRLDMQGQKQSFSLPEENITTKIPANVKYNVFGIKGEKSKESRARCEKLALARKDARMEHLMSLQKGLKSNPPLRDQELVPIVPFDENAPIHSKEPFHEKIKNSPDGKVFYTLTSENLAIKHPNEFTEHINVKNKKETPKPPELIIRFLGENPYVGLTPKSEPKPRLKQEVEPIKLKGCCVIL